MTSSNEPTRESTESSLNDSPDTATSELARTGPDLERFPHRSSRIRKGLNLSFMSICVVISAVSVVILGLMLFFIIYMGHKAILTDDLSGINFSFFTNLPSNDPSDAGIGPAMIGTVWVCALCALVTLPLGVATAILLEEFKPRRKGLRGLHALVQINITNLAGVPSVVYGIIGLTAFVFMFDVFGDRQTPFLEIGSDHYDQFRTVYRGPQGEVHMLRLKVKNGQAPPSELKDGLTAYSPNGEKVTIEVLERGESKPTDEALQKRTIAFTERASRYNEKRWYGFQLPLGRGILAAALTLMLVTLPVIIIASQESLRAVPSSLREGALGLGATPWQVVRNVTLPASIPGIMTGSILAMSRAIGEAAPILIIAGSVYVSFFPSSVVDDFTVMPLQIYAWAREPKTPYHELAAGGIIALLFILFTFNAIAVLIRQLTQKPLS